MAERALSRIIHSPSANRLDAQTKLLLPAVALHRDCCLLTNRIIGHRCRTTRITRRRASQ
jgi:hypothetical protein